MWTLRTSKVGFGPVVMAFLLISSLLLIGPCHAAEPSRPQNLVAGLAAEFEPVPNYADTVDAADPHQLTDGVYSKGRNRNIEGVGSRAIWGQKSTVGWVHVTPITIRFDLGRSQRIDGISLSSAAGAAGVYWPRAIAIMVSDDGKAWRFAGELMSLSRHKSLPKIQQYSEHRFEAQGLNQQGRYIAFIVSISGTPFFFSDEIEVYATSDTKSAAKIGGPTFDSMEAARKYVADNATRFGVGTRLARDYMAIREELIAAKLLPAKRKELSNQLEAAAAQIDTVAVPPAAQFRGQLPLNEPHARMLGVHGALLAARGLPPFFAWKNHRYDYLEWLDAPPAADAAVAMQVSLLGDEQRGDAFWVGNASSSDRKVEISLTSSSGTLPKGLRLYQVPWVDTAQNAPMPCALLPIDGSGDRYQFTMPAGLTTKVWCQVDGSALPPGNHRVVLTLRSAGREMRVPLDVRIRPLPAALVKAAGDKLSLGFWDYTDRQGAYAINPGNIPAAIALARDYGTDMPSGGPRLLPQPAESDFDKDHNLIKAPDYTELDEWVARWPNSHTYTVFLNWEKPTFAGTQMGTPAFEARVSAWGKALLNHLQKLQLRPSQMGLLLIDEPTTDEKDAILAGWLQAFKKGAPELTFLNDPVWPDPTKSNHQDAMTLPAIICPNLQIFLQNKKVSEKYYGDLQAAGQSLWFYQCSAAARLTDPTRYFRYQAWWAFHYNADAIHYWALGDTGGAINSWNEYTAGRRLAFTPAFIGPTELYKTVQLEAIRDGMQDHRTFTLLRAAAAASSNTTLKAQATQLLSDLKLEELYGKTAQDYSWNTASGHDAPDRFREHTLELLDKLGKS